MRQTNDFTPPQQGSAAMQSEPATGAKFGPVVSRLWPSESRPTPGINPRAIFFLDAFDINSA
ncbi:MAG TPA: hypothetical protein DCQ92_17340 [Verrucomicrobia subdivision 3 bacterium]|nr:hypothetical protein [Limisphaerales bacterium]